MSNGTTSPLQGWRKILATLLMIAIPAVNGTVVGVNLQEPKDYNTNTLIVWVIMALLQLVPAIATLIAGADYLKRNTEQNIAAIESQAKDPKANSVAVAQPAAAQIPTLAAPDQPYKMVDLDAYITKAESNIKADGFAVDPMKRAYYFYPAAAYFDLRPVPREYRIAQAKEFIGKSLALFTEAFLWYTKLPAAPTPTQASNYHAYSAQLKREYEAANNVPCSNKTFDELKSIVTYFNDLYTADDGLNQLMGKTVDWSIYGGGAFTPTKVGWDYAKLV
jgi:hypothetical protein